MRLFTALGLLAGACACAQPAPAPAYRLIPTVDGANLLTNPGMETAAGWVPHGQGGFVVDRGAGREGGNAFRAERTTAADPQAGARQSIELNQTAAIPLVVTGWSRAENVDGYMDSDYSVYCDLMLADGSPLWGQVALFQPGTHGWQRVRVTIDVPQPVRSITVLGLFRNHTGRVWFDDFSVSQIETPDDLMRLDGQLVQPIASTLSGPRSSGQAVVGGRAIEAELVGAALASLKFDGTEALGTAPGGFLVRDVTANGDFVALPTGDQPDLGLSFAVSADQRNDALHFSGALTNTDPARSRALTLIYVVPLQPGWQWTTMHGRVPPTQAVEFGDWINLGTGSNGRFSRWPLGTIANATDSLTLALAPNTGAQYRIGFEPRAGLFYIAYDFGLLPAGPGVRPAQFGFGLLPGSAGWGLRDGVAAWHRAYPEVAEVRVKEQGNWMAFARISRVQGWEDFGFRIKEGDNETAWDDEHGILTFRYSEMGTWWMPMPPDLPRTYEAAVTLLRQFAADPTNARQYRLANGVLQSGSQDSNGKFQCQFINAPWCDGAVWSLNPSPHLSGDHIEALMAWGPEQQAAYAPGVTPELDGEYLDSLEGYVTADLNYRPDHLAAAQFPLTFIEGRPVLHKALSIAEFCQRISADLHGRGRLLMANGMPYQYGFLTPWFDVLGTETDWHRAAGYQPMDDDTMLFRRALSGGKPYVMLMNTLFADFGPWVEPYFQRALAYGFFPSMFSHNAAEDQYFERPDWYNRDRELFRRYLPLIKQVAEAGWQPVTGARARDRHVTIERFGPGADGNTYLTVHNNSDAAVSDVVQFEAATLGRTLPDRAVELAPYATTVWTLDR